MLQLVVDNENISSQLSTMTKVIFPCNPCFPLLPENLIRLVNVQQDISYAEDYKTPWVLAAIK